MSRNPEHHTADYPGVMLIDNWVLPTTNNSHRCTSRVMRFFMLPDRNQAEDSNFEIRNTTFPADIISRSIPIGREAGSCTYHRDKRETVRACIRQEVECAGNLTPWVAHIISR